MNQDALLREVDRLRRRVATQNTWLSNISGALFDAGTKVGGPETYADAIRALTVERKRDRVDLARVRAEITRRRHQLAESELGGLANYADTPDGRCAHCGGRAGDSILHTSECAVGLILAGLGLLD